MAIDGRGMEQDPARGRAWLEAAAAQGRAGRALQSRAAAAGERRRPICAGRSSCCEVAAKAEIPDAQHALGVLYLRGPRRRPGHDARRRAGLRARRERQLGRRGRIRHPALQRRRRAGEREPRRRAISAAPPRKRQRHRPEPPGAPLRGRTRRAEEPDRGRRLAHPRVRPGPRRHLARRALKDLSADERAARREARGRSVPSLI